MKKIKGAPKPESNIYLKSNIGSHTLKEKKLKQEAKDSKEGTSTRKSIKEFVENPAEKSADSSANNSADSSAGNTTDNPTDNPTDNSVEGPVNSTEKSIKEYTICVCGATGCRSRDSLDVIKALKESVEKNRSQLSSKNISIRIKQTGCHGFCQVGPTAIVLPEKMFYCHLKPCDSDAIINSIITKEILLEKTFRDEKRFYSYFDEIPFFKYQNRVILKDCGFIDPLNLEEYLHLGGFAGLKNAVFNGWEKTLSILEKSKLRGRGGAGFPTAKKWKLLRDAKLPSNRDSKEALKETLKEASNRDSNIASNMASNIASERSSDGALDGASNGVLKSNSDNCTENVKYIVCNADEGDPGAFMDRGILESNPFMLLEGMLIASFTTGAKRGFIYLRKEYPLAEKTLKNAIKTLYERGFLGENVLGLGFDFDLELVNGAGAFVCGEETALIHSIEGQRGSPRPRPPYPAEQGIYSMPTNINNVKTYCCATQILKNGADWFLELGDENSGGTLVLALSGKIKNTGLVEVNFGEKISTIIEKIGGGAMEGHQIKAIQTGGPSGGCIPYTLKNLKIGYESLKEAGSIVGSGGMIVLDETNSILELAHYFLDFTSKESCGQCTPCREGTRQMKYMLERIISKDGSLEDIKKIERLAHYVKENSLCGLGQTAPNPILSSLKYFRDEYLSKVSKPHLTYKITDSCIGCHNCYAVCPVKAIQGEPGKKHIILQDKCIHCGQCVQSCPINSIIKVDINGKIKVDTSGKEVRIENER